MGLFISEQCRFCHSQKKKLTNLLPNTHTFPLFPEKNAENHKKKKCRKIDRKLNREKWVRSMRIEIFSLWDSEETTNEWKREKNTRLGLILIYLFCLKATGRAGCILPAMPGCFIVLFLFVGFIFIIFIFVSSLLIFWYLTISLCLD